jgi:transposase
MLVDNASFHRASFVKRSIIERKLKVQLIFNVPYSPAFNAQEKVWAKLKHGTRRDLVDPDLIARDEGFTNLIVRRMKELKSEELKKCGAASLKAIFAKCGGARNRRLKSVMV